jgi:hypothetical protein
MRMFAVFIFVFFMFGCASHVPLTKGIMRDYNLSSSDISRLQLYISDGILLEKRIMKIDKNIDSSSFGLKKVEDYYVKQIYFKSETPCIAVNTAPDKLAVAFEWPGGRLNFRAVSHNGPSIYEYQPDKKFARDTLENRPASAGFGNWKTIGAETYADTSYNVLIRKALPILLVDKTSLRNFTIDARKVKGLRQTDVKAKY